MDCTTHHLASTSTSSASFLTITTITSVLVPPTSCLFYFQVCIPVQLSPGVTLHTQCCRICCPWPTFAILLGASSIEASPFRIHAKKREGTGLHISYLDSQFVAFQFNCFVFIGIHKCVIIAFTVLLVLDFTFIHPSITLSHLFMIIDHV